MRARRQYSLHEERRLTTWQAVKSQIPDLTSAFYQGATPAAPRRNRFLQVAVSVTPHANFTRNLAGVTRPWNVPIAVDPANQFQPSGRAERVGRMLCPFDPQIQGPRFEFAGNSHPYTPGESPGTAGDASFLEQACAHANFLQGVVEEAIAEIEEFIASNGAEGAAWTITFEFSPFGFLDVGQVGPFVIGDWYQSGIVRSATYTVKDYLVMTLTADYPTRPNYAARPDHGQRGLVVTCVSLDQSLRPGMPVVAPFDFTLPRETLAKYHRRRRQPPDRGGAQPTDPRRS